MIRHMRNLCLPITVIISNFLIADLLVEAFAFSSIHHRGGASIMCHEVSHHTSPTGLYSSQNDDRDDEPFTTASTLPMIDFRMFLTQRCIQSFMFLLASMRDPHTIKWLDDFTRPVYKDGGADNSRDDETNRNELEYGDGSSYVSNDKKLSSRLLHYHGVDAMNTTRFTTWESYFADLIKMPPTTLLISTPNNPHLPEFEVEIEPPRLCARILSVREQIAREWIKDLDVIGNMGFDIFYSYWENVNKKQSEQKGDDGNNNSTKTGFERQNLMFLEWDPNDDGGDFAPSPFRKGNFDLLANLATQESVHRVLRQGISVDQDENGEASIEFLKKFYAERLERQFNGDLRYGRADDFIEELMLCTPRMITTTDEEDSSGVVIVNPVTIAEVVLKTRENVAAQWKEIARNSPEEHFEIRKLMLNKMMGK